MHQAAVLTVQKATQACWNPQPSGMKGTAYPELCLQRNSAFKIRCFLCSIMRIVGRTNPIPRAMQPWHLLFFVARHGPAAMPSVQICQGRTTSIRWALIIVHVHTCCYAPRLLGKEICSYGRHDSKFRKVKDRLQQASTNNHAPWCRHCWCWHT